MSPPQKQNRPSPGPQAISQDRGGDPTDPSTDGEKTQGAQLGRRQQGADSNASSPRRWLGFKRTVVLVWFLLT